MSKDLETLYSESWFEEAESDNPFAARKCYCHGYDVYQEILPNASWSEYLYLMFRGERPSAEQAKLLEKMAVVLAHPGLRDHSVRAAMNGGVGGSNWSAALVAAISVGAGQYGGGHEIALIINVMTECQTDLTGWVSYVQTPQGDGRLDVWPEMEHVPGFDPNGESCPLPVISSLQYLSEISPGEMLPWLNQSREDLEKKVGYPLSMSGVMAACFFDLGFNADEAEVLYMLLRLPGAAASAIEQRKVGWRKYPFFGDSITLTNDPKKKSGKHE